MPGRELLAVALALERCSHKSELAAQAEAPAQWQTSVRHCANPGSSSKAAKGSLRNAPSRARRGLLQLAGTIHCSTGRNPFAYLRYGCYCGLGGNGWPRDPADWCCFEHDCCYGKAEADGCAPKMQSYTWECENKRPKCEDIEDKCRKLACECDRTAAKCLAKAPYNPKLILWPDTLCGTHSPQCEDDD